MLLQPTTNAVCINDDINYLAYFFLDILLLSIHCPGFQMHIFKSDNTEGG